MFETFIVKTVDMTVKAQRASDNEVRLAVFQHNRMGTPSSKGSANGNWKTSMQLPDHNYEGRL
jgi:hypothetical protein